MGGIEVFAPRVHDPKTRALTRGIGGCDCVFSVPKSTNFPSTPTAAAPPKNFKKSLLDSLTPPITIYVLHSYLNKTATKESITGMGSKLVSLHLMPPIIGVAVFLFFAFIIPSTSFSASNNFVNHNHDANAEKNPVEVSQIYQSKSWEGDAKEKLGSLVVTENYIDSDNSCEFCTLVDYTPSVQGVTGMSYVDDKGFDLTNAKRVTFYVIGLSGDATIKFMVAGKNLDKKSDDISNQGIFKNQKFAETTQSMSLGNDWKKLEIDVSKDDLKNITHPFAFEIKSKGTGEVAFYIKYIIYDSKTANKPLPTV